MRAHELAEILLRYPGHLVQLESPSQVVGVVGTGIDTFDVEDGPCVVISGDWDED